MCLTKVRDRKTDSSRTQTEPNSRADRKLCNTDYDQEEVTQEEDPQESVARMNQICEAYGAVPNPRMAKLVAKHSSTINAKPEKFGDICFSISSRTKLRLGEEEQTPTEHRKHGSDPADDTVVEKPKYRYGKKGKKSCTSQKPSAEDSNNPFDSITEENYMHNVYDMEYISRDMLRTLGKNGIPRPVQLKNLKCDPHSDPTLLANNDKFTRANLLPNTFISNAVSIARQQEVDKVHTAKDLYAKRITIVLPPIDLAAFHEMSAILSNSRRSVKIPHNPTSDKSAKSMTCQEISQCSQQGADAKQ